MNVVAPIKQDATSFIAQCLANDDGALASARRVVIYAELPDGTWRCFYLHMNKYHFAFAGAALQAEALRDTERVDLGEVT